jgi:integrase
VAVTGCRSGEALGLRWGDLDLEAGTATIVNHGSIAGGTVVEGPPKTKAGARTISLDADTARALRSWRKVQAAEQLAMGAGSPDTGLVFTNAAAPVCGPARHGRVPADRRGARATADQLHGLRHTAATWLIASGVNPRVVQQRLGHADVSVTLGVYTHVLPGHDVAAAEALGRAIRSVP